MNNLYELGFYDDLELNGKNRMFYSDAEGFNKGNMEIQLYSPYRNYNPSLINPSDEKDRLLLEIQKCGFTLVDLGIYLDIHPKDNRALTIYNENRNKYVRLVSEFNHKYYPLMALDNNSNLEFSWLMGSFPFLGGK